MSSYADSSVIFGSTMIIRTSAGDCRKRSERIIVLRPTDLPEPVVPAMRRCGIRWRSTQYGTPSMFLPRPSGRNPPAEANASDSSRSRSQTVARSLFGTSMPTTPLPGIGAMMRIRVALSAIVSSLSRFSMRASFTPATGENS